VGAIDGEKLGMQADDSERSREGHGTSGSIATEALAAICIEVNHLKIIVRMGPDEDQAVGTNSKLSVTKGCDKAQIAKIPVCKTVVHHHKIIACALVLEKGNFLWSAHRLKVSKCIMIIRNNASSSARLFKTADNR